MVIRLKIGRLVMALALSSLTGCISQPVRQVNTPTFPLKLPATPIPSRSASAPLPLEVPTGTAQNSASQTSRPTPEWTKSPGMKPPEDYADTINKARQDLAARLGLDPASVQFIQLSLDEFPADTLGCLGPDVTPRPIPAIVSGQVILLEAGGLRYTYHARQEQVFYCGPWP
jgi:hypothetical protein